MPVWVIDGSSNAITTQNIVAIRELVDGQGNLAQVDDFADCQARSLMSVRSLEANDPSLHTLALLVNLLPIPTVEILDLSNILQPLQDKASSDFDFKK